MAEWQDIAAKLGKVQAEVARYRAEISTVSATIAKLEATLPLAQAREGDFKQLGCRSCDGKPYCAPQTMTLRRANKAAFA